LARGVVDREPGFADPEKLAEALGIPIRLVSLAAAQGGLEAVLLPDFDTRFVILCDPWVEGRDTQRVAFRIAHELAHTLFYDWDQRPPCRLRVSTRAEEDFCDEFAGALTG
jgi:hypothetical protein